MANWEQRVVEKKKDVCEDNCGISDIGLFCSLACFIPWAKFISMPGSDEPCCIPDPSHGGFQNVDNTSVSSNRSIIGDSKYTVKESVAIASHISNINGVIGSGGLVSFGSKWRNKRSTMD